MVGEPDPPREAKTSGANGGRNWRTQAYVIIIIIKMHSTCHEVEAQR